MDRLDMWPAQVQYVHTCCFSFSPCPSRKTWFQWPGNLLRECSMKPFPPACRGNRYFRAPLETLGVFDGSAHDCLLPSACRGKGRLEAWEASKSIAERYDPLYLSMKRVSPCLPGAPGELRSNLSNHAVPHFTLPVDTFSPCRSSKRRFREAKTAVCNVLSILPVEEKAVSKRRKRARAFAKDANPSPCRRKGFAEPCRGPRRA